MCSYGVEYNTAEPVYQTDPSTCAACTDCAAGSNYQSTSCLPGRNRVCTDCTTCAAGTSYETTACTITQNRGCTDCSTCAAGTSYETTPCTPTQNRGCSSCTLCSPNVNYESRACSVTQNRQCTSCSTCTAGTSYETTACTVTQNRGCASCSTCAAGTSYETSPCTVAQNRVCTSCRSPCTGTIDFQSAACNVTHNRVCTPCTTQCASGYWIASACNMTQDLQCSKCVCPAGTFLPLGACTGATTSFDAARDCVRCYTVADCGPGTYLSGGCTGSERVSNICIVCTSVFCPSNFYAGGCSGATPPICTAYRTCGSNQYLSGAGQANDGSCATCRNCTSEGLRTVRPCGGQLNAACGGETCNATLGCASTNNSARYCEYAENPGYPTCGVCPGGYTSDNQFCMECPEGKTCTRRGAVSCEGMCDAGVRSQCDGGFAKCDSGGCEVTMGNVSGMRVMRGTYENPAQGDCVTYVRCNVGYYKRYVPTGSTPQCLPCRAPNTTGTRFVSGGLSPNDAGSCLWECDGSRQVTSRIWLVDRWQCNKSGTLAALASHEAGWYGIPGSKTYPLATCASGYTAEASTALVASECKACPSMPANAIGVAAARNCEWACKDGWDKRGERCVQMGSPGWVCRDTGTTTGASGECVSSSVPWNRAGRGKTALEVTARVLSVLPNRTATGYGTLVASSAVGGVGGRHTVARYGGQPAVIAGPLCSMTTTWVGGYEYLIGAVCNQSFLVFLNLSDVPARQRLDVLIGQAGSAGWADGFKTQARFETELYVTRGAKNQSVWVLDRWNCVVREVSVWSTPGDYRTRVYTVHGSTDKFIGAAVPQAKCYGAGSLASPRRFWELGMSTGSVLFSDDNGLWQLELASGALSAVMREGWDPATHFEADDVQTVIVVSAFELVLEFFAWGVSWAWSVTASEAACPDGTTSNAGGDCVIGCAWLDGGAMGSSFVNQSSGECTACLMDGGCSEGQEFVACTRSEQGWCRTCAIPVDAGGRVFAVKGKCDAYLMKYAPPCPAGYYAGSTRYCERCPLELASTRFPNATRVEQCKCKSGLRRTGAECTSDALFVYGGVCAAGGCIRPPNATLGTAEWQQRRCMWECDVGFYHDTNAGWVDKCRACVGTRGVPLTRGDDDSPLSCEYAWDGI